MTVNPIAAASVQTVHPAAISASRQVAGAKPAATPPASADSEVAQDQPARATSEVAQSSPPDRQELERALRDVRKVVEPVARNLLFSIDDDTGRTLVKVVNSATKEVIRQIPSEEIISIAKALDKLKGLLIKQEA